MPEGSKGPQGGYWDGAVTLRMCRLCCSIRRVDGGEQVNQDMQGEASVTSYHDNYSLQGDDPESLTAR